MKNYFKFGMELAKLSKSKRGAMGLGDLPAIAQVLVYVGIVFGIGAIILASFMASTTVSANEQATAIVNNSLIALGVIPNNWLGTIVLVLAAVIILGLVAYIGYSKKGGR